MHYQGTYSNKSKTVDCDLCPAGQSSNYGESSCRACVPGTYSPFNGSPCIPCYKGSFSNISMATVCTNCSVGFFSDETGSTECKPCAEGTYSSAGSSICRGCLAGQYLLDGVCRPCPLGTTSGIIFIILFIIS